MTRKILWMLLSFLLVAALVLASCGPAEVVGEQEEEEEEEEEPVGEQEEEEEEEPAVGEPQYGGTLTISRYSGSATSADFHNADAYTTVYAAPVCDFLIMGDFEKYGPRGTNEYSFTSSYVQIPEQFYTGTVIESLEISPERIILHVRTGVYWQAMGKEHVMESRELTADDIVFSLGRLSQSMWGRQGWEVSMWGYKGGLVDNMSAEDRYTVVIETPHFDAGWLRTYFIEWGCLLAAPEVVEAGMEDWNNLVGTGPFIFKEYAIGSHIVYERNPNYWGTATINGKVYEAPFVDELVYTTIADESTRLAALRTGKLDVYYRMGLKFEDTLADTSPELLSNRFLSSATSSFLFLQMDKEPLDDLQVRRALMIALDLEAINKAVYLDGEMHAWPIGPEVSTIYTPIDELPATSRELYTYDQVKAKQMLADAGYPNGFKLRAIEEYSEETLVLTKSYWEAIGVELDIQQYEAVLFWAISAEREDYEVSVVSMNHISPITTFSRYHTVGYVQEEGEKPPVYSDPYIDELYSSAVRTVDPIERDAIFKELNLYCIDLVKFIPFGARYEKNYWWPWVKNYYGETENTFGSTSYLEAAIWIDQDLKADLGY